MFDPKRITVEQLLTRFFSIHDPTTSNRQGNGTGSQYRSVVTELAPFQAFVRAEDTHQMYFERHPSGYTCHIDRHLTF